MAMLVATEAALRAELQLEKAEHCRRRRCCCCSNHDVGERSTAARCQALVVAQSLAALVAGQIAREPSLGHCRHLDDQSAANEAT